MLIVTALAACAATLQPAQQGQTPTIASLGGATVSPYAPPTSASVVGGRLLEITLNVPGQTWQETFVVGVPSNLQFPAPVLTLFHGYGEHPRDTVLSTDLVDEAMSRGWLVFAPLGAHEFNYGIDYAQENIERAFEFIGERLPLDLDRIYGVGFSMGGGAAASYAARHLDPEGVRFAAIVNHTGTSSLELTYATSGNTDIFESSLMFDGSPADQPFSYRRSSTINIDPVSGQLDLDGEMAPNLSHVEVQNWFALYDPLQDLVQQTEELHDRLIQLGASSSEHRVNSSIHQWATLDALAVVDWLSQQTLSEPVPGDVVRTLADRSGAWHSLEIEQRTTGAFTPVLWSGQPSVNALYLIDMKNAAAVATDVSHHGLDTTAPIHVITEVLDGQGAELRLEGFTAPPSAVQYRGNAVPSWSYDSQTGVVTCTETGSTRWGHWIVKP